MLNYIIFGNSWYNKHQGIDQGLNKAVLGHVRLTCVEKQPKASSHSETGMNQKMDIGPESSLDQPQNTTYGLLLPKLKDVKLVLTALVVSHPLLPSSGKY
jgi:hypothetical protein